MPSPVRGGAVNLGYCTFRGVGYEGAVVHCPSSVYYAEVVSDSVPEYPYAVPGFFFGQSAEAVGYVNGPENFHVTL